MGSPPKALGPPVYHSRFGGLWTDRQDAHAELSRRIAAGRIRRGTADDYRHFIDKGFVILRNAVSHAVLEALAQDVERAWATGKGQYMVDVQGQRKQLQPELRNTKFKLLDLYVGSSAAREASFAPAIVEFLQTIFDEPCLAFQSLSFERGTEQALHQDTAYVVVEEPLKLAASWIALEDVRAGTGELEYYEGSHRLDDYVFGGVRKHWEPQLDGHPPHDRFLVHLHEESARRGLKRTRFLPKKGDALIWAADLAHGGSAITDTAATRRSLVTHYCPSSIRPHYMKALPERRGIASHRDSFYCSMYYKVPSAPAAPRAPAAQSSAAPPASALTVRLRKARAFVRKNVLRRLRRK